MSTEPRKQSGYLRRNLTSIEKLSRETRLLILRSRQYKDLLVIHEVFLRQKWLHDHRETRTDDRIVSVSQLRIRPIKRGKAGAATEFGAGISASLTDGFSFADRISRDAYDGAGDLIGRIESYRKRFGCYPAPVHADKICRTGENRRYCGKHGIRLSGPPMGRPPAQVGKKREARKDEPDRIPTEGKFGQGKRRFSLGKIMCKLAVISETAISVAFIVMNPEKWLKSHFFAHFFFFRKTNIAYLKAKDSICALTMLWMKKMYLSSQMNRFFVK